MKIALLVPSLLVLLVSAGPARAMPNRGVSGSGRAADGVPVPPGQPNANGATVLASYNTVGAAAALPDGSVCDIERFGGACYVALGPVLLHLESSLGNSAVPAGDYTVITQAAVAFLRSAMADAASEPPSAERFSIATDQAQYHAGDSVSICYKVPAKGQVKITDTQADGSSHVLLAGQDDGSGDCIPHAADGPYVVAPPSGQECLRLDFSASPPGTISTQTCFEVLQ